MRDLAGRALFGFGQPAGFEVEGDPGYTVELNVDDGPGPKITAMSVVNAVAAVCEAAPGLAGPLDVRRCWARNTAH